MYITWFSENGNKMLHSFAILQVLCTASSEKWIWWCSHTDVIYRYDYARHSSQ